MLPARKKSAKFPANAAPLKLHEKIMPADKKRKPHDCRESKCDAGKVIPLKSVKLEVDQLREKIQKSIIDNPKAAKKAAVLISLWIEGKSRPAKKAG